MIRAAFAVPAITFTVATCAVAADSALLKPKFDGQKRVYVESVDTTRQVLSGALTGGAEMTILMGSVTGFFQESKAAGDGATTRITFDRSAISMNHPAFGEMRYDSDAPPADEAENQFAPIFSVWPGKTLVLTTDAKGEVTKVEGWDKIVEAMENNAAGEMMYEQIRPGLTEDAIKHSSFERRYAMLPNREVKVGEEWKTTSATVDPIFGEMVYTYDCKLEEISKGDDGPVATITYKGEAALKPGVEPKALQGMTPKLKTTRYEGRVRFDVERGAPLAHTEKRTHEFALESPQGALDIKRETTVETTTTDPDARAKANAERAKAAEKAAEEAANEAKEKTEPAGG